jgi:hypothetical protein
MSKGKDVQNDDCRDSMSVIDDLMEELSVSEANNKLLKEANQALSDKIISLEKELGDQKKYAKGLKKRIDKAGKDTDKPVSSGKVIQH